MIAAKCMISGRGSVVAERAQAIVTARDAGLGHPGSTSAKRRRQITEE
jgi:hypothetical protein